MTEPSFFSETLERIRRSTAAAPSRAAYVTECETLTYARMAALSDGAAEILLRQGASPVLLLGHKEAFLPVMMLACLKAGRAYVPLEPDTPRRRLASILRLSGAGLCVCAEERPDLSVPCVPFSALAGAPRDACGLPAPGIAYMIFTSGSTGEPKCVPVSNENLDSFTRWICSLPALRREPGRRVLNQANFCFDLSVADLYYAFCGGHTLYALQQAKPGDLAAFLSVLEAARVQTAVMTPTFLKYCLLDGRFAESNLPHLDTLYLCGEPLESAAARRLFTAFPHVTLLNAYGPTEAASAVSAALITPSMAAELPLLPVGEAGRFATEITVENGEIVLSGSSVFGGYRGAQTGGWFIRDGKNCYRTGDLGALRDGYLFCAGRRDRQIKYKGYRIELDEIEQCLLQLPGVAAAAVVPQYAPGGGVRLLKAFVVAQGASADSIRTALSDLLPGYMIPKTVRLLENLPQTPNGKTDRKALALL